MEEIFECTCLFLHFLLAYILFINYFPLPYSPILLVCWPLLRSSFLLRKQVAFI
ncbi:hypothetical protein C2W58_04011 [Bacillus pumilus]|nr:hypothetical protein C2W58_04011 [Bacillus pumilus]